MNTLSAKITKHRRGWDVDTEVYWDGFKHPSHTGQGATTLAWALWRALELCADGDATVTAIIVNDKPMSKADAMDILRNKFGDGPLAYQLPRYEAALDG